jgi:hypothetical protein
MPFCDHDQLLASPNMRKPQKETAISGYGHDVLGRRKAVSSISSGHDFVSKIRILEKVYQVI